MVIIVPGFVFVYFLPNQTLRYVVWCCDKITLYVDLFLSDGQNLVEENGMFGQHQTILGNSPVVVEQQAVPNTKEAH
jgi:hypothetical protein